MMHPEVKIVVPDSSSFNMKRVLMTPGTYKIHSHKNFELNYIVNGWGNRIIGNNIESFTGGDLVLMGPNLQHCWEVKGVPPGVSPECITIHFHESFFGHKNMQIPELIPVLDLFNIAGSGIQFYGKEISDISCILDKMHTTNPVRKLIYLFEIFEILVRTKDRKVLSNAGYLGEVNTTQSEKLKYVYEYILANFSMKVKLEDVAHVSHLSSSAFCRFFERSTGKSLFKYLKEVRIGYACKLLQESDMQISDICYQSGYNNFPHFNNHFKKICGITPSQYRKNLKLFE